MEYYWPTRNMLKKEESLKQVQIHIFQSLHSNHFIPSLHIFIPILEGIQKLCLDLKIDIQKDVSTLPFNFANQIHLFFTNSPSTMRVG